MNAYAKRYRETFARLGVSLAQSNAMPDAELAAAAQRLGIRLPEALRAYYLLAGRELALNTAHDTLLPPDEWQMTGDKLVFLRENQAVVVWSVAISPFSEDPEVFQGPIDFSEWYPEHPVLSEFLDVMLHWQAVMGSVLACSGSTDIDETVRARLDRACVFAGEINQLRAYSREHVVLCLVPWDKAFRLFVAGPDEETLVRVLNAVGCNWVRDFDHA
jgi:hypothetical protein